MVVFHQCPYVFVQGHELREFEKWMEKEIERFCLDNTRSCIKVMLPVRNTIRVYNLRVQEYQTGSIVIQR